MAGRRHLFLVLGCAVLTLMGGLVTNAAANPKYAAFVIHADTGDVLLNRYADSARYPASLTKLMTLYMLFEEMEAGNITLTDKMIVSKRASMQPASKLGLARGSKIDVETAIEALIIGSAYDVATVVAERLGGTESKFARMMTARARELGMRRTTFRNASGLPDRNQRTTARDMAILAQRVTQDFPQYFHYFDKASYKWKGRTYKSHNRVTISYQGADGLKTGYTRASGYNLATTAKRGDHRLIGIVLGGRSGRTRDAHMKAILDQAYRDIRRRPQLVKSIHRVRPMPGLRPDRMDTHATILAAIAPNEPIVTNGIPVPNQKPMDMAEVLNLASLQQVIDGVARDGRDALPAPFGYGDA